MTFAFYISQVYFGMLEEKIVYVLPSLPNLGNEMGSTQKKNCFELLIT